MRVFTVQDLVDAIRKNGLTQLFDDLFNYDNDYEYILSACALGQANINLKTESADLVNSIREQLDSGNEIISYIIQHNDELHWSLKDIAEGLEEDFPEELDKSFEVSSSPHEYKVLGAK